LAELTAEMESFQVSVVEFAVGQYGVIVSHDSDVEVTKSDMKLYLAVDTSHGTGDLGTGLGRGINQEKVKSRQIPKHLDMPALTLQTMRVSPPIFAS
jgi:hypothetical protein